MTIRWKLALVVSALVGATGVGCGGGMNGGDAGDVQSQPDTNRTETGADVQSDSSHDTGMSDSGPTDTGVSDTGTKDTGVDSGPADSGFDAGPADTGPADTGPADTGPVDTGFDAGPADTGPADTGPADTGPADTGPADTGPTVTCAYPIVRALSTTDSYTGVTTGGTSNVASTTCQMNTGGPDQIFSLHIATRTGVILSTADAATTFDTVLSIRRMCDVSTSEVACNDDGGGSLRSLITTILDPGDYFVIVDGYNTSSGTYHLAVSSFTPAPNTDCSAPTTLPIGTTLTAQSTTGATTPNTACTASSNGGQLFYSLTVPAGQRVAVNATPMSGTAVLRVLSSCAATSCITYSSAFGAPSTSIVDNTTGVAPMTVIVSVSSTSSTTPLTFDISASVVPAAPNATCASATMLTNGVAVTNQNTAAATSAPTGCLTTDGSPLYYTLSIPAGQRAVVTATSTTTPTQPLAVRVLLSCGAGTCAANSTTSSGGATSVVYSNTGTAPVTVVVSVGTVSASTSTTFSVVANVSTPPGYTQSTVTGMCDDMTTATTIAPTSGWSDDSYTAVTPLPIPFTFFGSAEMSYSVTSNGFLQLYPGTTGSQSSAYSNTTIPSTATPNGFVAPFWDDLLPVSAVSDVRVATIGATPSRHMTVQWTGWNINGSTGSLLTFQAKLFETTNAIELHYCTLTPGTTAGRETGSSATIGLEDATGTLGTQAGYNTAGTASTATAYRFVPTP